LFETLQSFDLSAGFWLLLILCGVLIGIAKTGISGAGMLVVPILAGIFGGRPSAGLLLPMLCFGDIFGVTYYHRHAEWRHIWRLMPWAAAGIAIGLFVGAAVTDLQFNRMLSFIILAGLAVMIWRGQRGDVLNVPEYRWFAALMGLAGGFTTMIGNAAGPVMALYLLSMRLPKYAYIGTGAWFFMIVNLAKVPLHIFVWHTITVRTVTLNVAMIPSIALGAGLGIWIVRKIPEKVFRWIIIAMTAAAAVKLIF